ncbi:MAG: hypothetical protein V4620_09550 [Bacteroidota bacterium]
MKSKVLFLLILFPYLVNAQNDDKLTPLKAPTSPSSIIIGSQPNTVSRPKSWQAVETSLISNYFNESGNIIIPKDYSLEVTPFWLDNKAKITIEEFLNPGFKESFWQNLSFSISSTKDYLIKDTIKTDAIGIGARTMLWQGSKDAEAYKVKVLNTAMNKTELSQKIYVKAIQLLQDTAIKSKDTFINKLILAINNDLSILKDIETEDKSNWIDDFRAILTLKLPKEVPKINDEIDEIIDNFVSLDKYITELTELQKDRTGFRIELASAIALNFPTNSTNYSYAPKYGVWLTPSYQDKNWKHFEMLGVLRFLWNDQNFIKKYLPNDKIYDQNYDYGLRLVYKYEKFSIEAEIIGRYSDLTLERTKDSLGVVTTKSESKSDIQYLLNLNYRISDSMVLSYNLGKKFDVFSSTDKNLISVVTINYGIGAPKKSNIKSN